MWQFDREPWVKLVQGNTSSPYFFMKTASHLQIPTFFMESYIPSSFLFSFSPLPSLPHVLSPYFFFLFFLPFFLFLAIPQIVCSG